MYVCAVYAVAGGFSCLNPYTYIISFACYLCIPGVHKLKVIHIYTFVLFQCALC